MFKMVDELIFVNMLLNILLKLKTLKPIVLDVDFGSRNKTIDKSIDSL